MSDRDMHVIEHFGELRRRLIMTALAFLVSLVAALIYVEEVYHWLVRDLDGQLAVLGPSEILWVYMKIAGVVALAVTLPVAGFQVWRFVKPALTGDEAKATLAFIPWLFVLFVAGISFGYFVLFPIVLSFLTALSEGQFLTMFTADKYFGFMMSMTVPFGFLFEMPVVVMFLTRLGILNPMRLAKARKLSYFGLVVVSILITPPDLISDVLVIVPLLILYECSVTLSKFVYRKQNNSRFGEPY